MYEQIIDFWFHETDKSQWFRKDEVFDTKIRNRFTRVHEQAIKCELWDWRSSSLGSLAEIIVLDQFSRNIYRGKAQSFHYDSLALALAQNAIHNDLAAELSVEQKSFLYMPFMHSESLAIHDLAVTLFTELGEQTSLDFAYKHKAIIEQFGRYPHRNNILERSSTEAEQTFLLQPGSSF